ncbi:GTP cyclohydrolase I [Halosimplex marinum]|uniref:GTP cyclohydrolase I n=1 Tax=Halosimplex marinum TaxID=3396620 RepID=UPI003F545996
MVNKSSNQEDSPEQNVIDKNKIKMGMRQILEGINEDPDRDSLTETWKRRAPKMLETLSEGYRDEHKPEMKLFETSETELIIKSDIPIYSLCEHHLLPYTGKANIAYKPDGKVVGLSKLIRYVRWRSRRLTIQEELTRDIAKGLRSEINAQCVIVELEATHLCETMRGVETETSTRTMATAGNPSPDDRNYFKSVI